MPLLVAYLRLLVVDLWLSPAINRLAAFRGLSAAIRGYLRPISGLSAAISRYSQRFRFPVL